MTSPILEVEPARSLVDTPLHIRLSGQEGARIEGELYGLTPRDRVSHLIEWIALLGLRPRRTDPPTLRTPQRGLRGRARGVEAISRGAAELLASVIAACREKLWETTVK